MFHGGQDIKTVDMLNSKLLSKSAFNSLEQLYTILTHWLIVIPIKLESVFFRNFK
jgi:hypothetical protein